MSNAEGQSLITVFRRCSPFIIRHSAFDIQDSLRCRPRGYHTPLYRSTRADEHVLHLGIEGEGVHAQLPADSTQLVAAKGRLDMNAAVTVDAEDPGSHALGHTDGPADV